MTTVIIDFDSTIITVESLEEILKKSLEKNPEALEKIRTITEQGMDGTISFEESLKQRLAIARPSLQDVLRFAVSASRFITPGMHEVFWFLSKQKVNCWIVSGGFQEAIFPTGGQFGISRERILAVRSKWSPEGAFLGVDNSWSFCKSKVEGVKAHGPKWDSPRIVIGDGMTDYALFSEGYVDNCIAFTANVRRQALVDTGVPEAKDSNELRYLLSYMLT